MEAIDAAIAGFKTKHIVGDTNGQPKFRAPPTECISYHHFNEQEHIALYDLTWDNLQVLGNPAMNVLQDLYNIRRQIYEWLQSLAKTYGCELEMVGTDSMNSDMDINVKGKDRILVIQEAHQTLNNAVKPIGKNIEEVFDINMYASSFSGKDVPENVSMHPQYKSEQRLWAYVHLYEAIQLGLESLQGKNDDRLRADIHHLLIRLKSPPLNDIFNRAQAKWNTLVGRIPNPEQFGGQADFTKMTDTLHQCDQFPNEGLSYVPTETVLAIVDCLSTVQFYSRETYYTRGAYMHVVENHTNLTKEEYIESIIDNLAFVVEQYIAHYSTSCEEDEARIKYLRKLGKYLYRIFHAFSLIFPKQEEEALRPMRRKTLEHKTYERSSRTIARRATTSNLMMQLSLLNRPSNTYQVIYRALRKAEESRKSGDATTNKLFADIGDVLQHIGASTSNGSPTIIQSIFEIVFEGISLADSKVLAQA